MMLNLMSFYGMNTYYYAPKDDPYHRDKWDELYLGKEGSCSMYIDAVKGEFARTSRSPERVSWNDIKLLDYYASLSN